VMSLSTYGPNIDIFTAGGFVGNRKPCNPP
jgi:hypothetical protein